MIEQSFAMRRRPLRPRALIAGLLGSTALAVSFGALANPQGSQVAAGSAAVSSQGSTLTVNQSSERAIINWQSFSIAPGQTTDFIQLNASAITLNRVTGVDPSSILGNLDANGQVWLINPNGIAFGKSARVDVAGLLATTIDIANSDFLSGNYRFSGLGNPGAMVTNAGQITIHDAGLAALVAPGVENDGIIEANLGQIQLSSAAAFTVDFYGDGLFNFSLDSQVTQQFKKADGTSPTAAVTNSGQLIANGGRILLTANVASNVVNNAINMSGIAQATSATESNGEIVLDGGSGGTVQVTGSLNASGHGAGQTGGTVEVTGQNVQLASTSKIDVSGNAGGGTALVGGDLHGGGTLRHASTTQIAKGATINADAIARGNGGEVVVWSDDQTSFAGTISAKGSSSGGNGGSAEVSSHGVLGFAGTVDLLAPNGQAGGLLLDPENVTIASSGQSPSLSGVSGGTAEFDPVGGNSILSAPALEQALTLADVVVTTGVAGSSGNQAGNITVATNIAWNGNHSLTLSAYQDVIIDTGVTISNTGSGNLSLQAGNSGTGVGTVTFASCVTPGCHLGRLDWSGGTGLISIFYNPTDNPAGSIVNATSFAAPQDYTPFVSGNGSVPNQLRAYMLVNSVYDLQNIENNLAGAFALGRDIDASQTATWNNGSGFVPIGSAQSAFTGQLFGQGYTINNLFIADQTSSDVGLFAVVGKGGIVSYLALTNLLMTVARGNTSVSAGAVAGFSDGVISDVNVSGSIDATGGGENNFIGGLVGQLVWDGRFNSLGSAFPQVVNSSADVAVTINGTSVSDYVGGLIGIAANGASITGSHSSGSITAQSGGVDDSIVIGGLIGVSNGRVQNSYSTSSISYEEVPNDVSSSGGIIIGGLIGEMDGDSASDAYATIGSYATGSVEVTLDELPQQSFVLGGLVGDAFDCMIEQSYARGSVRVNTLPLDYAGNFGAGGLVGREDFASIDQVYSTGSLSVPPGLTGGLIGEGEGTEGSNTNAFWDIETSNQLTSAGGVGMTTAQLKSGLPTGFDPSVWQEVSTINAGYPSLLWQSASAPPPFAVTHISFGASGTTTAAQIVASDQLQRNAPAPRLGPTTAAKPETFEYDGFQYPLLSQLAPDGQPDELTPADQAIACLATVYAILAQAIGYQESNKEFEGAKAYDFWDFGSDQAEWGAPTKIAGDLSILVNLPSNQPWNSEGLLGWLATPSHDAIINGTLLGEPHHMLAIGVFDGLIVAIDPLTGTAVRLSPSDGSVKYIMDPQTQNWATYPALLPIGNNEAPAQFQRDLGIVVGQKGIPVYLELTGFSAASSKDFVMPTSGPNSPN